MKLNRLTDKIRRVCAALDMEDMEIEPDKEYIIIMLNECVTAFVEVLDALEAEI